jgi:general secretion pathway protein K
MSARAAKLVGASDRESGFILVAVLWMIAALAALAGIYATYAINTAATSHVGDDRLQTQASIRAGVELAVARVLATPDAARASDGAFDATLGRATIHVKYRPEDARIDLNAAPRDMLSGLFTSLGVSEGPAREYAQRVVGWRKKVDPNGDNPEAKLYASAGLLYRPRQGPFNDTLELGLVLGLPPSIVDRALPFITVYSGQQQVNVFDADRTTLAALPGMTDDILKDVLDARANRSSTGRDLLRKLGMARNSATVFGSKATRASIMVALDDGRRVQAEVVFRLRDDGAEPYDILWWRDDFDGV